MPTDEPTTLIHRYFDALNRADTAELAALVAPEWQQHVGGQTSVMNPTHMVTTLHTNFADLRYTVLDAFSNNYRVAMVEDGCFDRSQASHAITLCDMNAKYADVVKTDEVLSYFDTLQPGMFDLPRGVA